MVMCLVPAVMFAGGEPAEEENAALQFTTKRILSPTKNTSKQGDSYAPNSYIYFGVNGDPIKWRVLDSYKTSNKKISGMFLLSEYLLDSNVSFRSYVFPGNNYQGSDAQRWCRNFAADPGVFSDPERNVMRGLTKEDSAEKKLFGISWGKSNITEDDKMFFLSVREVMDYIGNYDNAPGLAATDSFGNADGWWLRSPYADGELAASWITPEGFVDLDTVSQGHAARPAFNLNTVNLFCISAAAGGKSAAGMEKDLTAIPAYYGNEWKLTLYDSSRNGFNVLTSAVSASTEGGTVKIEYTGAKPGANEYVSAILCMNGSSDPAYYGRSSAPVSEERGTVEFTIPAGLAEGDYVLRVFSEQYNGDYRTDYVSFSFYVRLTVSDKVGEQFTLTPGGKYYFDLSAENLPGTVNGNLPDGTLHYVPFTYVGAVNSYVLGSASSGLTGSSDFASRATDPSWSYGYTYLHSMLIADNTVTQRIGWDRLDEAGLIFGRDYESGGVSYTLRAPTVGSNRSGSFQSENERGTPLNNEWDSILDKNSNYIKNWAKTDSWGQDTSDLHAGSSKADYRAYRGFITARLWHDCPKGNNTIGYRPVLEIRNADALGRDGLKVITLNLDGGTLGGEETVNLLVKNGGNFSAPAKEGLTRPDGKTGDYLMWIGNDGNRYAPGESVPSGVTSLSAQWEPHTHCVCGSQSTGGSDCLYSGSVHEDVSWMPWTATDSLPTAGGYYYLTNNVVLPEGTVTVMGNVYLCLNGKIVRGAGDGTKLDFSHDFAVTDCSGTGIFGDLCVLADTIEMCGGRVTEECVLKIDRGTFVAYDTFQNAGTIRIGSQAELITVGSVGLSSKIINYGKIRTGIFLGEVLNEGSDDGTYRSIGLIRDGTFTGKVTNNGMIKNGEFHNLVINQTGFLYGGRFRSRVDLNGGTVVDGEFTELSEVCFNGGWVYGGIYYGTVNFGKATIYDSTYRTVTFDSDGGSPVPTQKILRGQKSIRPANPEKTGHSFDGWFRENSVYGFNTPVTDDVTVKAAWTVNQYTITIRPGNGSADIVIRQDYGTAVSAPANPTRTGYLFAGWDVAFPTEMPAENQTITARWTLCDHSGSTAQPTCTASAICTDCAGTLAALGHAPETGYRHDETHHWMECMRCTAQLDSADHTGGTATCTESAICSVCRTAYGVPDPTNHTGTADWTRTLTTHEKRWSCCEEIFTAPEPHRWENGICPDCGYGCSHEGGTATCCEKAVCTICHNAYGEPDGTNHAGGTEIRNARLQNCTENGYTGDLCCKGCGEKLSSGTVINADGHKGGTATCTGKAVCEVCHERYGEPDGNNHTGLEPVSAVPATAASTGILQHWRCTDCGKLFADADGKTEILPEDTVVKKLAPSIIEGRNGIWGKGSENGLIFGSDAAYADFVAVLVDGDEVSSADYTLREDRVSVELKAGYLATLTEGRHTLTLRSASGDATTSFTVAAGTVSPPTTAADAGFWSILAVGSLLFGIAGFAIAFRRRKTA